MNPVVALAQALEAQPQDSQVLLQRFVAQHRFPITQGNQATFFFWDGLPADQVVMVHWVHGLESRQGLDRIGQTHAFFRTVHLPHRGRIEYKFEVQRGGGRHWVRDPHNPLLARDPFGANSVCPMPGYREPAWIAPEPLSRPGSMEHFSLASAAWGDVRGIDVYLPNEYKAHKRYPLLICQDGADYQRYAGIQAVLDNLITRHEVVPMVVAFTNGSDQRNVEYGANPRQAAFLVDELLPALQERYGLSQRPTDRGLMGASFGGVSTLFTAWERPGVFGRLLVQSGSLVFTDVGHHGRSPLWDPVVDFVNALRLDPARLDARVFLSCGTFESLIAYNRALAPVFRKAGLPTRFVESPDGHNWVAWRDRLRDGLSWLFPGHLRMTYD